MAFRLRILLGATVILVLMLTMTTAFTDVSPFGVCIRNCAQCKKMFGDYFAGQLCATACVKFKGKIIPDCVDIESIAPFLSKYE